MCDCDCELPKRERWAQIREEAMKGLLTVPARGRFLVYEGKVRKVAHIWRELGPTRDGRTRWGVVTEEEKD